MPKRKWSVDEKQQIVLAGLKGNVPITELCRKHGISTVLYYRWKKQFLEGGRVALRGDGPGQRVANLEKDVEEMKSVIGELTLANRLLKKALRDGED